MPVSTMAMQRAEFAAVQRDGAKRSSYGCGMGPTQLEACASAHTTFLELNLEGVEQEQLLTAQRKASRDAAFCRGDWEPAEVKKKWQQKQVKRVSGAAKVFGPRRSQTNLLAMLQEKRALSSASSDLGGDETRSDLSTAVAINHAQRRRNSTISSSVSRRGSSGTSSGALDSTRFDAVLARVQARSGKVRSKTWTPAPGRSMDGMPCLEQLGHAPPPSAALMKFLSASGITLEPIRMHDCLEQGCLEQGLFFPTSRACCVGVGGDLLLASHASRRHLMGDTVGRGGSAMGATCALPGLQTRPGSGVMKGARVPASSTPLH